MDLLKNIFTNIISIYNIIFYMVMLISVLRSFFIISKYNVYIFIFLTNISRALFSIISYCIWLNKTELALFSLQVQISF